MVSRIRATVYLIVNNSRLVLADPMSFEQFHVTRAAETNTARFAAPLTEQGAGRVVGNDVRVCTAWFRAQSIDEPWLTAPVRHPRDSIDTRLEQQQRRMQPDASARTAISCSTCSGVVVRARQPEPKQQDLSEHHVRCVDHTRLTHNVDSKRYPSRCASVDGAPTARVRGVLHKPTSGLQRRSMQIEHGALQVEKAHGSLVRAGPGREREHLFHRSDTVVGHGWGRPTKTTSVPSGTLPVSPPTTRPTPSTPTACGRTGFSSLSP